MDFINEEVKKQAKLRRKAAIHFSLLTVGKAALAALVAWGLYRIGFISDAFLAILVAVDALTAAFFCGVVWGQ